MKQELKIDIPEKMIGDVIRSHMVKALGNKKEFLDALVKSALEAKKDRFNTTTIFQDELANMIRVVAKKTFEEWIETQKEKIREAILKRLKLEKESFVEDIADKLITGLQESFYVSVRLKVDD